MWWMSLLGRTVLESRSLKSIVWWLAPTEHFVSTRTCTDTTRTAQKLPGLKFELRQQLAKTRFSTFGAQITTIRDQVLGREKEFILFLFFYKGAGWIWALNGAGTSYLSSDGIFFAGDYGYFTGFKNVSGVSQLMWEGEMFYNLCTYELACSGTTGCGSRNCAGKFTALDATPNDKFLFIQQRYGRDFRYKLRVPTPGWHFVILLSAAPALENRNFEVRFEEGEGASHEAAFTVRVKDSVKQVFFFLRLFFFPNLCIGLLRKW